MQQQQLLLLLLREVSCPVLFGLGARLDDKCCATRAVIHIAGARQMARCCCALRRRWAAQLLALGALPVASRELTESSRAFMPAARARACDGVGALGF